MKKILTILGITSNIFAATIVQPYSAYIKYDNNIKDKGAMAGVYISNTYKSHKFEIDTSWTSINYLTKPDLSKIDLTLIDNYNYKLPCKNNLAINFKAGIHNVFINQNTNPTNYNKTLIVGAEYILPKYKGGLDIYLSSINGYSVCQYSPKFRVYLMDLQSCESNCNCKKCEKVAKVFFETQYNYIKTAKTTLNTYNNIDFKLQIATNNFTTILKASFGKNKYKVSNGGLNVNSLEEESKYSYGVNFNYAITSKDTIELAYCHDEFEQSNIDGSSNLFVISYLRAF